MVIMTVLGIKLGHFNFWTFGIIIVILRFLSQEVTMMKLASLRIPRYTIRGQPVRLECHYDLEHEALYSVKWYKDGKEFYRFLPGDNPPAQRFDLPGFKVDLWNSTDNTVTLKDVDFEGFGIYRCEVSGEAPAFETVIGHGTMKVIDLPDNGPQIEGGSLRYSVEDVVRVNCTSPRAKPAAKLIWHINGEVADERFLRRYPIIYEENDLETSVLGLQFKVKRQHFKNKGGLKIKCVAKIEDFYWRTNEENVLQDHPERNPALESKATFPGISSKATPTFSTMKLLNNYSILVLFVIVTVCSTMIYFIE